MTEPVAPHVHSTRSARARRVAHELYAGTNSFDFTRAWRVGFAISGVVLALSGAGLLVRGLNLGIDFEGGGVWEVPTDEVSVPDARSTLEGVDQANAKIQIVTSPNGDRSLRVQAGVDAVDESPEITEALADLAGVSTDEVNVNTVGPSWGDEITRKAQRALVFFFIVMALYMSIRLEPKMAVGGLVAVGHDILVTVGAYALFQWQVTPATVIAFLTILGYSLYDTIVVYDKVWENTARIGSTGRLTYTELMSLSLNQVLMRSVNTTVTTVVPVASLLLVGANLLNARPLQDFSLALLVGLLSGMYSSLFIAAPVVTALKEREPEWRERRERLSRSSSSAAERVEAQVTSSIASPEEQPGGYSRKTPPRPRKRRR